MVEQLSYLNNINKPNLVDYSLLQKINDGYNNSPPKLTHAYSFVQTAGAVTFKFAKDNIFISVVVISLILFLGWCYIEKQRQNTIYEKYLQKKLVKSLLSEELNLFSENLEPLNIDKLFDEIKTDMSEPIEVKAPEQFQSQVQEQVSVYKNHEPDNTPKISLTKREANSQINEANQQYRAGINPENQAIPGSNMGSRFMEVTTFNQNSYMLV